MANLARLSIAKVDTMTHIHNAIMKNILETI